MTLEGGRTPPLSLRVAARRLGLSYWSVRRAVLSGRLEAPNVGCGSVPRYRVTEASLSAFTQATAERRVAERAAAEAARRS
ncbi:MAG TPA: hypothetical protein VKM54_28255 [Myxococcota bacterium]|nr:hypothetical protein [Myxococcota bacterium]